MAKLHIDKLAGLAVLNGTNQPVAAFPPRAVENPAIVSGTSTPCTDAAVGIGEVWLLTPDVDCFIEVGATPVATANSTPLFAGEHFPVQMPKGAKVAVIGV